LDRDWHRLVRIRAEPLGHSAGHGRGVAEPNRRSAVPDDDRLDLSRRGIYLDDPRRPRLARSHHARTAPPATPRRGWSRLDGAFSASLASRRTRDFRPALSLAIEGMRRERTRFFKRRARRDRRSIVEMGSSSQRSLHPLRFKNKDLLLEGTTDAR